MNPVERGDDGDLDGFSDLIELLMGTLAYSEVSMPAARGNDSDGDGFSDFEKEYVGTDFANLVNLPAEPGNVNLQPVFDVVVAPQTHNATGY